MDDERERRHLERYRRHMREMQEADGCCTTECLGFFLTVIILILVIIALFLHYKTPTCMLSTPTQAPTTTTMVTCTPNEMKIGVVKNHVGKIVAEDCIPLPPPAHKQK